MSSSAGHRERLRRRFQAEPGSLTEVQLLEFLLTYAIPRQDTAPPAGELLARFGSIENVLAAPERELAEVTGIGEATLTFLRLLRAVFVDKEMSPASQELPDEQLTLFDLSSDRPEKKAPEQRNPRRMRVFSNDEVANSLDLLPRAPSFYSLGMCFFCRSRCCCLTGKGSGWCAPAGRWMCGSSWIY